MRANLMGDLRRTVQDYRRAAEAVEAANEVDREPTAQEYWARDDAAVQVADVADELIHLVDMARRRFEWQRGPERVVSLADGGKVTGTVRVVFNSGQSAYVGTDGKAAHEVVTVRGTDYHVSVQVDRQPDGAWKVREARRRIADDIRRANDSTVFGKPVAKTILPLIVEAIERTVTDLAQPHVLAEADYADACRTAYGTAPELIKAEKTVVELREVLTRAVATIDAFERPGETSADNDNDNDVERRWVQHSDDSGTWCPWSHVSAPKDAADDAPCPARCRASRVEASTDKDGDA
jgi:hypothetical protein